MGEVLTREETWRLYQAAHARCPLCGGTGCEATTVGILSQKNWPYDTNRARCLCGWQGIVDNLLPRDLMKGRCGKCGSSAIEDRGDGFACRCGWFGQAVETEARLMDETVMDGCRARDAVAMIETTVTPVHSLSGSGLRDDRRRLLRHVAAVEGLLGDLQKESEAYRRGRLEGARELMDTLTRAAIRLPD